jgi:hypothetical protein
MLKEHNIDMVNDTLKALIVDYEQSRTKKDPIAEHEKFRAPHKH